MTRKRKPLSLSLALGLASCLALVGCGYRLANTAHDPLGPFVVEGGAAIVPDATLMAAAEEGAATALAQLGALAPARAPHSAAIVVEILRVDADSDAVALTSGAPLAQALRVTVTGRATLRTGPARARSRDTGDVRVTETIARLDSPEAALLARGQAARRAARRLGERLVRRVLGYPEPSDP